MTTPVRDVLVQPKARPIRARWPRPVELEVERYVAGEVLITDLSDEALVAVAELGG